MVIGNFAGGVVVLSVYGLPLFAGEVMLDLSGSDTEGGSPNPSLPTG